MCEDCPVHLDVHKCVKNTELEFMALIKVLDHVSEGDSIYTNCQRIIDLIREDNPKYPYHHDLLQK